MNVSMYKRVYYITIVENVRNSPSQDMRCVNTIRRAFYGDNDGRRAESMLIDRYGKPTKGRLLYASVPETPYKDAILKCGSSIGYSYSYWAKDGASDKSVYHTDCIYVMRRYAIPDAQYKNMSEDDPIKRIDAFFDWDAECDIVDAINALFEN